ncbi:MAG: nitroreductase family protein [Bacteroidales bacterium]
MRLTKIKNTVKYLLWKGKSIRLNFLTVSPSFARINYSLFNSSFKHEQHKTLAGIAKNISDKGNIGNLRRNIHRLEKGLISIPPKPVFAEGYIRETVHAFLNSEAREIEIPTYEWAYGILHKYFDFVDETPKIKEAKELFNKHKESVNLSNFPTPYKSSKRVKSSIGYDEFHKLNLQRRSVRYYKDIPVPRKDVEKAIETALLAPSACNRQPFTFRIIDSPDLLREAVKLPIGATTFSDNIKMMIFVIGDLSNYFDERDKHLIYIDSSLSTMGFVLALETLGLSSCIINWSDIKENNLKLNKFLQLKKWEQCVLTLSVGYASDEGGIPCSNKKSINSVIKYN